jgi:tetratricopeptide (TPR) repeat protein
LIGVDALFAGALALEDAGRFDEALERYRRLLVQAPGHADAWHNQGLLLARLGRLAEAEQSHRAYVQAHPQSARARGDLDEHRSAATRADFIDDRADVLEPMRGIVANRFLFGPQRKSPRVDSGMCRSDWPAVARELLSR